MSWGWKWEDSELQGERVRVGGDDLGLEGGV